MSRSATAAINIAAAFLPKELRKRYREQWTGDLRDASDVGVSAADIARGSFVFAATYIRPMSSWAHISSRADGLLVRLAVALSFSSAVVSISQYASLMTSTGSADWSGAGLVLLASTQSLTAFTALAPLLSLVVVFATRGTDSRLRLSVSLLALASVLPLTQPGIDNLLTQGGPFFTSLGSIVFLLAAALVIAAGTLLVRFYRSFARPENMQKLSHRLLTSSIGGLLIGIAVTSGLVALFGVWEARKPLVFGLPVNEANRDAFAQWLLLKFQFETFISTVFGLWVVAGLIVACLIAASGFSARATGRRSAIILGVVALTGTVFYGGIMALLQMSTGNSASTSIELLMTAGRWGLIGITTSAIVGTSGRALQRDSEGTLTVH